MIRAIRAILTYIAGGEFEVRLINLKSGKKIPGTLICRGSYFKCRRVWRDKHLKYGQMVRLQAVAVLDYRINDRKPMDLEEAQEKANQIANQRLDNLKMALEPPAGMEHVQVAPGITEGRPIAAPEEGVMQQPELPAELGEPVYKDELPEPDHKCDDKGPQDWREADGQYHPTCSVCGAMS